jgi:cytochrome P450
MTRPVTRSTVHSSIKSRVAELEADIEQIAHDLISSFEQRDEIEFLDAFAIRLPLTILADQLGVAKDDIETFKFWTDVTIELVGQVATPEREVEVTRHVIDMQNYLAEVIERVRKSPNESIISRLANVDVDGRTLTMRELMGILQQLLVAGNDTTTATLGSAMKLLVEQPEYVDRLRTEPALIPKFVDEALRLRAAVQVLFRRATEELEIHGVTIPKDAIVEVRFGAANLDPEVFENPAAIDLERDNGQQHLAFGAGKHFCIGNQLARAEVRIALGAFIERLDNFKFSRGEDSYNYLTAYIAHGVDKLWMSFDSQLQKS